MNINEVKIGDRVRMTQDYYPFPSSNPDGTVKGDTGTVCEIYSIQRGIISVEWDRKIKSGHDCDGNCRAGYGWRVNVRRVERIVSADPDREYDSPTGADLNRLLGITIS